jgi:hypothetical protein
MVSNMHCRSFYSINDSICSSSFIFTHLNQVNSLNHRTSSPSSYHDQIPLPAPRRRRRLEDPVLTSASNYYTTYPRQASQSPHRIYQPSEHNGVICDLFNLLERPPPPVKQRKKYTSNGSNSARRHRSIDYKNAHAKLKDRNNERKHHHQQQPSYYHEKTQQDNKLSSIQQYDRLQEKEKITNCIYQRQSSNKGFLRRVARQYFCMPMTNNNSEFSS